MTDILRDSDPEAIVAALEENEAQYWLYRARVAGWEVHEDPEITWYRSGDPRPQPNGVVRTSLTPDRADARIAETIAEFRGRGLAMTWWGGTARRPADLGRRLLAHGFTFASEDAGMATDLTRLAAGVPAPEGLRIKRVRSDDETLRWRLAFRAANDLPLNPESAVLKQYAPATYGDDDPFRLYFAELDGDLVATSQLLLAAGVAGVYCVATAPAVRRRGIGAAVTRAALRDAVALGYRVAVLGATEMGAGVYRNLGFSRCSTLSEYTLAAQ